MPCQLARDARLSSQRGGDLPENVGALGTAIEHHIKHRQIGDKWSP